MVALWIFFYITLTLTLPQTLKRHTVAPRGSRITTKTPVRELRLYWGLIESIGEGAAKAPRSKRGGAVAMSGHDSSNSGRKGKHGMKQTKCSSNNLPSGASAYLRNRSRFPGYFREDELILWIKYLLFELRELSNAYECEHDAVPRDTIR